MSLPCDLERIQERGRKLGGRKPEEPKAGPRGKDQINLTDEESRIMPVSGGGFEQCYNAQASVDMGGSLLIVGNDVTQNTNDKQEIAPAVKELAKLPEEIGKVENAAADSGYLSAGNVEILEGEGINPYIVGGRQPHYAPLEERLEEAAESKEENKELPEIQQDTDPMTAMRDRMKTDEGKAFYAKRKSTVEPVFGIIKNVMGFRQFMLRGLNAVSGEWNLVCIAFNLKRICALC
ncbi:MAG: transposase [Gammaproteobacteria bacterium]|nr:transposase [Gammaproteobacteria bacterium]